MAKARSKPKLTKTTVRKKQPSVEERESTPAGGLTPRQLLQIQGGTFQTPGGVIVTETSALGVSAVYCAVDLISSTIASLEHHPYTRLDNGGKKIALDHPAERAINLLNHTEDNAFKFWRSAVAQALTFGSTYSEIEKDGNGDVFNLHLLDPRNIELRRQAKTQKLVYHDKVTHQDFQPSEILHINALGYSTLEGKSPVRLACSAIGIGLGAQTYVENFLANGLHTSGYLKPAGRITQVAEKNKKDQVAENNQGVWNTGRPLVLQPGWDFIRTTLSSTDAQLHETRKYVTNECSRIFRIPLCLLGEDMANYKVEEVMKAFISTCLRTWLTNIEAEEKKKLFKPQETRMFTSFNLEGLLRGDPSTMSVYHRNMLEIGAITDNEIRAYSGLNPYPEGDRFYISSNNLTCINVAPPEEVKPDEQAPDEDLELFNSAEAVVWAEIGRALRRGLNKKATVDAREKLIKYTSEVLNPVVALVRHFNPSITVEALADLVADTVERMTDVTELADVQRELVAKAFGKENNGTN